MPLIFLILGILFLVLARNNTQGDFETLLKSEFSGSQSFIVWVSALVILGLVGFWKPARPITDAAIGLIILVLILSNKGLFAQFNNALRNPTAPAVPASNQNPQASTILNTYNSQSPVPVSPTNGALLSPLSTSVLPN
jgi:hypothetical protein